LFTAQRAVRKAEDLLGDYPSPASTPFESPENLLDRLDILLIRNMAHVVLEGFTNISIYSIYNRLEVTA